MWPRLASYSLHPAASASASGCWDYRRVPPHPVPSRILIIVQSKPPQFIQSFSAHHLPPFPGTQKSKVIDYQPGTSITAERQELSQKSSKVDSEGSKTVSPLRSQRRVHGRGDGAGPQKCLLETHRHLYLSTAFHHFPWGHFPVLNSQLILQAERMLRLDTSGFFCLGNGITPVPKLWRTKGRVWVGMSGSRPPPFLLYTSWVALRIVYLLCCGPAGLLCIPEAGVVLFSAQSEEQFREDHQFLSVLINAG